MKIIIDTNALMLPYQSRIDIFSLLEEMGFDEFIVLDKSIGELKEIKERCKGKDGRAANVALDLTRRCKTLTAKKSVDESILEVAKGRRIAVLTNDKELKEKLAESGVKVVYPRGRMLESR